MKRILALVLAALMLLVCVTGCQGTADPTDTPNTTAPQGGNEGGNGSEEPIEIVLWHTYTDHHQEALNKIIDGFNASQSKYVVIAEQQPYSEFDSKLLQSVSRGIGPDFCTMFASDAIKYIDNGLLYDMTDLINDPDTGIPDFKEQIVPGLYSEITQWGNERIYMFPVTLGSEVLFYNKTMFDALNLEEPKTWNDVEVCAKAIHDAYGIAGFGTDSVTDTFQGWMVQAGSGYIDPTTKQVTIDRDLAIEKLNWFAKGVQEGYFRLVGEDYYFSNPFGSQKVGMYVGAAAGIDYVYAAIPEGEGHFELGCCPIPQEGTKEYISSWGSTYVCLSRDAEHAAGVVAFLKYMSQKDVLTEWAMSFGALPARIEAVESDTFQEYAATNVAVKALTQEYDRIGYLPSIEGAAIVRTEIDKMVVEVAQGLTDAETAFDNFLAASNAALNAN